MSTEANQRGQDGTRTDKEPSSAIEIRQITDLDSLLSLLSSGGLSSLYQDIFGKAPYFEKFTDEDVRAIFEEYIQKGLLFIACEEDSAKGFGAALPMNMVPEIEDILNEANVDTLGSWYMADLGVNEELRHQGVGKRLVQSRINAIPDGALIVMRTSIDNVASQTLYRSLGFTQAEGAYQEVEQARVDGTKTTDKRLFLMRQK